MESTGVYWKPVWNVLEEHFHMRLANAQHIKAVPGRKTDMKDCQWIAELLKHGLVRGSYVPTVLIRDLRDLTRTRATLSQEQSSVGSRIQKVLESANIKLSSTGLTKVGLPGSPIGIQKQDPTLAELLKPLGYMTFQNGKNHLGDRDEFLPNGTRVR